MYRLYGRKSNTLLTYRPIDFFPLSSFRLPLPSSQLCLVCVCVLLIRAHPILECERREHARAAAVMVDVCNCIEFPWTNEGFFFFLGSLPRKPTYTYAAVNCSYMYDAATSPSSLFIEWEKEKRWCASGFRFDNTIWLATVCVCRVHQLSSDRRTHPPHSVNSRRFLRLPSRVLTIQRMFLVSLCFMIVCHSFDGNL